MYQVAECLVLLMAVRQRRPIRVLRKVIRASHEDTSRHSKRPDHKQAKSNGDGGEERDLLAMNGYKADCCKGKYACPYQNAEREDDLVGSKVAKEAIFEAEASSSENEEACDTGHR